MTTQASAGITGDTSQQSAKDRAAQVGGTAKEETANVASTAKEQTLDVAHEAAEQARDLVAELRSQVRDQVDTQRGRIVDLLREFGDELEEMAGRSERSGPASEVARQVAGRARDLRGYLEGGPDVGRDLRRFARRRPGAFLVACAAAGVLAGRATRGAAAARQAHQDGSGDRGRVIDLRGEGRDGGVLPSGYEGSTGYTGGTGTAPAYSGTATYEGAGAGIPGSEGGDTTGFEGATGVEVTADPTLRPSSGPGGWTAEGVAAEPVEPIEGTEGGYGSTDRGGSVIPGLGTTGSTGGTSREGEGR